jgi:hypothetical protein
VDKTKPEHAGKIKVIAENDGGSAESSAALTVLPQATLPEFIVVPTSMTIKEKETVEFHSQVRGTPKPTVRWTINEKVVESSTENITIREEGEHYYMKMTNTKTTETGKVMVKAENSVGRVEKSAELIVERLVVGPQFKNQLLNRDVAEGEPLRWDISLVEPMPGTTLTWILNEETLTTNEQTQIVDHGDGSYHLTLTSAKTEMTGSIACRAVNEAGSADSRATVRVSRVQRKPEFTKSPQDHVTTEDESIKFSAVVTGYPTATIAWYHNGKQITESEEIRVKYEESTGKTSIRFLKPKLTDSGKITVKAENSVGRAEAGANLKVEEKTEPPRFLSDMDDRQVNEGQNVKFSVKVAGAPKPEVTWLLNGQPLTQSP